MSNGLINASNNTKLSKDGGLFTFVNGKMKTVDVKEWIYEGKKVIDYVNELEKLISMKKQYELAQKPHCVFQLKGRTILHGVTVPGQGYVTSPKDIPAVVNTNLYKVVPYLELDSNDKIFVNKDKRKKYELGGIMI